MTAALDPEFANTGLPKWPQLYMTGAPVTLDQAKEIIFATDRFLISLCSSGGNNHRWETQVARRMGIGEFHRVYSGVPVEKLQAFWTFEEAWRKHANALSTNYLHNTWAASCFIGGPHGWCSPQGRIFFSNNVGKWPSVTEVYNDLVDIAARWPFLQAAATLMSGEEGEDDIAPLITFIIKDGVVTARKPAPDWRTDHHETTVPPSSVDTFIATFNNPMREQGLPQSWVDEYADRVKAFIEAGGGIEAIAAAHKEKQE